MDERLMNNFTVFSPANACIIFIWNGDETEKSGTGRGGQTFACHDSHVILVYSRREKRQMQPPFVNIIYIWEKRQKPKPRHNKARKKADGLKKNSQITARGGEQQHVYEPPW